MWTPGESSQVTLRGLGLVSNGSNIRCSFIRASNFLSLLQLRPCFSGSPRGRKQWLPFLSRLPPSHGVASAASLAEQTPVACFLGIGTESWMSCFHGGFPASSSEMGPLLVWDLDAHCHTVPAKWPPPLQRQLLPEPAAALGRFLSFRTASHLEHLLCSWARSVSFTSEGCSAWPGSAWTSQGLKEPQKQSAINWGQELVDKQPIFFSPQGDYSAVYSQEWASDVQAVICS